MPRGADRRHASVFVRVVSVFVLVTEAASCGDERSPEGGDGGGATTSAGGGGSASSSIVTTASATSAGGEPPPNGCADGDFVVVEDGGVIVSNGTAYAPRCAVIPIGATVTFEDDFTTHPLVGGLFVDGRLEPDPASPIPETRSGERVEATFPSRGDFGYVCTNHAVLGMAGMIRAL